MQQNRTRDTNETDRGQAYVIEGVIGVLVIALTLVLGMQAVDIAPWASDENRNLDRLQTQAEDVLVTAEETGALRDAALCVTPSDDQGTLVGDRQPGDPQLFNPGSGEDTEFEQLLADSLGGFRLAIEIDYTNVSNTQTELISLQEPPRQPSTAASARVTLFDSDETLQGDECTPTGDTLEDAGDGDNPGNNFYFADQDGASNFYGVVTIRVIVW